MLAQVFCTKVEQDLSSTMVFLTTKISFTESSSSEAHVVLIENFFSTAVKFQFAAKLKDVLDKTSFQRKNHCLKGKQTAFFDTFLFTVRRNPRWNPISCQDFQDEIQYRTKNPRRFQEYIGRTCSSSASNPYRN